MDEARRAERVYRAQAYYMHTRPPSFQVAPSALAVATHAVAGAVTLHKGERARRRVAEKDGR